MNPLIIFMHIPKTGGLTLRKIIDQQYMKNEIYHISRGVDVNKLKERLNNGKIKAVYGHNRFGIHKYFSNRLFTYITLLRDPVERVISTYYYILERPQNRLHHLAKEVTFKQFVEESYSEFHIPVNNHQTRFLSGQKQPDLEMALKNMQQHFQVVGITEQYNESLFLMKKHFGWKNIYYEKINQTSSRPKAADLPESLIQLIESKNELDLALYNAAKKRLNEQLSELSIQDKKALKHYLDQA